MPSQVKLYAYRAARALGLFALARRVSRHRVRILAYHAFATRDEASFRSKLFINPETFARRLAMLHDQGYRVRSLDDATADLARGVVQPDSVVITIDDGYVTTLQLAAPLLHRYGMPATVYVTTYHMLHQTPVFDLAVAYLVWKSRAAEAFLRWPASGTVRLLDLGTPAARERTSDELIELGRGLASEGERVELCRALGAAVGVDYDDIVSGELFRLMSPEEARAIQGFGVAIGLHTHRHRFPPQDLQICAREIEDNRAYLREVVGVESSHFCYPSGVYDRRQWACLEAAGIVSATTCDTGLAGVGDPPLGLRRFLDGELVTDIEFEAEISGFAELLRRLLGVRRLAN